MQPQMLESPKESPLELPHSEQGPNNQEHQNAENNNAQKQIRIPRRPGRPSLRGRGRFNINDSGRPSNSDQNQNLEMIRQKTSNKSSSLNQENNMEGFIKIIDYLKKIDCEETNLHNKMNPYNLLTAICFWYIVSAEYFSFDFFNNRNPNNAALQILRKAQKTFVTMPQRIIKPLRLEGLLDFETPSLLQRSKPVTEKLIHLIKSPMQFTVDGVEKATYVTSVVEDDAFRSSTRAIIFNYLKKKIQSNQKWSSTIQPMLENAQELPNKDIDYLAIDFEKEEKMSLQQTGTQILYRQKRKINPETSKNKQKLNGSQNRRKLKNIKKPKKKSGGEKREAKDGKDDIFFHQSDEDQPEQNQPMKDEMEEEEEDVDIDQIDHEDNEDDKIYQKQGNYNEMEHQEAQNSEDKRNQIIEQHQQREEMNINFDDQNEVQGQIQPKQQEQIGLEEQDQISQRSQNQKIVSKFKTFTKTYTKDDILLDSIMHLPIDHVISLLQASLTPIQLPPITKQPLSLPKQDPIDLVYQIHPDEQKFLQYMKNRQEKLYLEKIQHGDKFQQKQRETQFEDAKCQVCTDGDYTQDNLIVFCSTCGISVHQRCVGLNKIPSENWICQVCLAFGPAGCNVPCPLCNVKGGALKRTSIHINQPLFKDTNPSFHEYSKSCNYLKQKQEYTGHPTINSCGQPQPYYDYFTKSTYPTDQPTCYYVWVHYVCAVWVPECYFEEKNGAINIKGVENIDKKRFKQKCLVCEEVRSGACVKCENISCSKYYHPECARKKKIYMQQLNLDKLRYLIFCEAHQPLKVKRKIDIKRKKNRDEIIKFCRGIEKYVETYKIAPLNFKLMKVINSMESNRLQKLNEGYSKSNQTKDNQKQNQDKVIVKIQRNTDEDFIKSVIQSLNKSNQIIVNLSKIGVNRYKVDEIVKPSKRDMRKSLNRIQEFWKTFNNGQPADGNLRRFNNIMRENFYLKQKIENYINYGDTEQPRTPPVAKKPNLQSRKGIVGRRPKIAKQTIIQEEGGIFCVCRKPYCGETDMFQCEVCNQWYHHQCIGFIGSEQDAQSLDFHCMKCMKYESAEAKAQRLARCSKFFSEDSLFLRYRPPTPSLQSQDKSQFLRLHNDDNQNYPANNEDNHSEQNEESSQKEEKYEKPPVKTKILAILNKPFMIQGPHQRNDDQQFFKDKKLKMLQILSKISSSVIQYQPISTEREQLKQKPSSQIQLVSFKGQIISHSQNRSVQADKASIANEEQEKNSVMQQQKNQKMDIQESQRNKEDEIDIEE